MLANRKMATSLMLTGCFFMSTSATSATGSETTTAMVDLGAGTLAQTATGLEWARSDNGADIDWGNASKYCAGRGPGWRLPSVTELLSIYDKSGTASTSCGAGYTCKVSSLFQLTGPWLWSNEANNALSAWIVILTNSTSYAYTVSDTAKKRALCVLSPDQDGGTSR
jgi:hypothetical protein